LHWHRVSPRAMVPLDERQRVTPADPARDVPGMVYVRYDVHGRLRHLEAVPGAAADAVDWLALFQAAGLDVDRFGTAEPALVPPVFADRRLAWEGPAGSPEPGRGRVGAAAVGAGPVLFDVAPAARPGAAGDAASRGAGAKDSRPDPVALVSSVARGVLLLLAFLAAWSIARRNLHAGRGDRRGASRVGSVLMGS